MRVQEIILEENIKRYILIDSEGIPVVPVVRYLKYLDNTRKSRNTLKTYCYALKHYFEYLEKIDKNYESISLIDLSNFVGWLSNPSSSLKTIHLNRTNLIRTEGTINLIIMVVTNFYDYLYRVEEVDNDIIEKLLRQVYGGRCKRYKDFLYHVNKDEPQKRNILMLKKPRKKIQFLSKTEVETLYISCTNLRDKFLIKLLFETGIRIGEALSLFIEDFVYDHNKGHRISLKNRGELSNGAKLKTGERYIYISQNLMDIFDDYIYFISDKLSINMDFVFVKLGGINKGQPLEYIDVVSLMKRLKKKTNIDIHAHLLRHTHATLYYSSTKNIKALQERLGHSQVQTTLQLYVHTSSDDLRKDWEKSKNSFIFST